MEFGIVSLVHSIPKITGLRRLLFEYFLETKNKRKKDKLFFPLVSFLDLLHRPFVSALLKIKLNDQSLIPYFNSSASTSNLFHVCVIPSNTPMSKTA